MNEAPDEAECLGQLPGVDGAWHPARGWVWRAEGDCVSQGAWPHAVLWATGVLVFYQDGSAAWCQLTAPGSGVQAPSGVRKSGA